MCFILNASTEPIEPRDECWAPSQLLLAPTATSLLQSHPWKKSTLASALKFTPCPEVTFASAPSLRASDLVSFWEPLRLNAGVTCSLSNSTWWRGDHEKTHGDSCLMGHFDFSSIIVLRQLRVSGLGLYSPYLGTTCSEQRVDWARQ